jgi:voltage-gated potassium channel
MLRKKIYNILFSTDKNNRSTIIFDLILYSSIIINIFVLGVFTFKTNSFNQSFNDFYSLFYSISIFFYTVELAGRIWSCVENDEYSQPLLGRIKYFFNPITLIDSVVVITYYLFGLDLNIIFFRSIRLFNLSQYIGQSTEYSPYNLIKRAIFNKKEELLITLFGSLITLIICSYLIYFVEKNVQPTVLENITPSLKWVFGVLTNSNTIEFNPLTPLGKTLHLFMIILGVLIIGLPLGIITGGFISEIEDTKKNVELSKKAKVLVNAFSREGKLPIRSVVDELKLKHEARWISLDRLSARLQFSPNELYEIIRSSSQLRIRAINKNKEAFVADHLIVEHFPAQNEFGVYLNRKSRIHIIATQNYSDPGIGHFSRLVSESLQANYYSNEYFSSADLTEEKRINFSTNLRYLESTDNKKDAFLAWKKILYKYIQQNDFVIYMGTAGSNSGADFHLLCGGEKQSLDYGSIKSPTHYNLKIIQEFYHSLNQSFSQINVSVIGHERFGNTDINHCSRAVHQLTGANVITIYVNIAFLQFSDGGTYYKAVRILVDEIQKYFVMNDREMMFKSI